MKLIYTFIFVLLFSSAVFSSDTHSVMPVIDSSRDEEIAGRFGSLFKSLSSRRGFNGNVLVSQQGRIIFEKSFGYSDLKKKIPLKSSSAFQIASVSKQFTAMAVMMLYEEGKLDFDDRVVKFFPDFPYPRVTIRQLLSHRGGLPDYMAMSRKYWRKKKGYMTNRDMMKMLVAYGNRALFEPDAMYRYSNTGYAVLAAVVEKVAKQSFDEYMTENIFKPLGMKSTFVFNPGNYSALKKVAKGYSSRRRRVRDIFLNGVVGDKGIYATVEDMFKWDQGLYTEVLVKQTTLSKAFTPESYDYGNSSEYGFGWRIENLDNGEKIVFHSGWWGGYNSLFIRRLTDRTAIVILTNKVNWSFNNIDHLMKLVDSGKDDIPSDEDVSGDVEQEED